MHIVMQASACKLRISNVGKSVLFVRCMHSYYAHCLAMLMLGDDIIIVILGIYLELVGRLGML